jgi:hypothetical protein
MREHPARSVTIAHLRRLGHAGLSLAAVLVLAPPDALAQETRAEQIAERQAAKAERVEPQRPSPLERVVNRIDNYPFLTPSPHGLYPVFGGIIDGGAGWLRAGLAYRRNFGDSGGFGRVEARGSIRGDWESRATLEVPALALGRFGVGMDLYVQRVKRVPFYGVGNDTTRDRDAEFELDTDAVSGYATVRPLSLLVLTGGLEFLDRRSEPGEGLLPGPRRVFEPADVPGEDADVRYRHIHGAVDLDWRSSPEYTRSGGRWLLALHRFDQLDGTGFSFRRVDVEAVQHVPFHRGNQVVTLRGLGSTTSTDSGQIVPHFMLPYVGDDKTVRGLSAFRLQDRHRLVVNVEYRWRAAEVVDMAVFTDAGRVGATRRQLGVKGLSRAVGVEMRLHGPEFTALRATVAVGSDGWRARVSAGTAF